MYLSLCILIRKRATNLSLYGPPSNRRDFIGRNDAFDCFHWRPTVVRIAYDYCAVYIFLVTCYKSVQKRTFARRAHFETPQLSIFRRLARHLLFQLFSLHPCAPKCVKTVSLETRPRMFVRVSASISPFDLSSFDMDFGLPRGTFSRFSFPDLNF